MKSIYNSYPKFDANQVLTHQNLNDLVSYLDEQGRLTRTNLIGIGIACGLEVSYDNGTRIVTISKGTGVTSEGLLITNDCGCEVCDTGEENISCDFTHYREYHMGDFGVSYNPFFRVDDDPSSQVDLFELLPNSAGGTSADILPLADFDAETGVTSLDDYVVLAFVECFEALKGTSCLGKTCDEKGSDLSFNTRYLLISREDLDFVLTKTNNQTASLYQQRFELPEVAVPKVFMNIPTSESMTYDELLSPYADTLFAALTTDTNGDALTADTVYFIMEGLGKAYDAFEPVLNTMFPTNPFTSINNQDYADNWKNIFNAGANQYYGIQYYYDFVKDLALAYEEFKEVACDLAAECCPDDDLFPKHLMLGELTPTDDCHPSPYRQVFIPSPIHQNEGVLNHVISLFNRAVLMVEHFDFARINDVANPNMLKITPSCEKKGPLSDRAIPYYYNINSNVNTYGVGTLEQAWNYANIRKCASGSSGVAVAYYNNDIAASSPLTPITTPLLFNTDPYNFLRIEGALGQDASVIKAELEQMKSNFNLAFDVLSLRLDQESASLEIDYDCGFGDIQEEYFTFRNSWVCFIDNLLTGVDIFLDNATFSTGEDDGITDVIIEIRGRVQEFIDCMPPCIIAFPYDDFKAKYRQAIQDLIDFLIELFDIDGDIVGVSCFIGGFLNDFLNSEDSPLNAEDILQDALSIATKLVYSLKDTLFFNKLHRLYYSFKRREYYYSRAAAFGTYYLENPGMEHCAGVAPGWTYIMVSNTDTGDPLDVVADFSLPYLCCGCSPKTPICNFEEEKENVLVSPYARPDLGITSKNEPIEINLIHNDGDLYSLIDVDTNNNFIPNIEVIATSTTNGVIPNKSDNNGDLAILPNGRVEYTPPTDFVGIDQFKYTIQSISNNTLQDEAIVTVLVRYLSVDLPNFEEYLCPGQCITIDLGTNFPDFVFTNIESENGGNQVSWNYVYDTNGEARAVEFCAPDFEFSDEVFNYKAIDHVNCEAGCGEIIIRFNDAPIANDDHDYTTDEDVPIVLDILDNDYDNNGTLLFDLSDVTAGPTFGTLDLDTNGTLTYTPNGGFVGQDSFKYRVRDIYGCQSNIASVIINVLAVNSPPIISNKGARFPIFDFRTTPSPVGQVLASDADFDPLNYTIASVNGIPGSGNYTIDGSGNIFVVSPSDLVTGTDVLFVRVDDGQGLSSVDTGDFYVHIYPVAIDDLNYSTVAGVTLSIGDPLQGVLANDLHPGNDPLTLIASLASGPGDGNLVFNDDGTFEYTPDGGFTGTDEFTYEVFGNGLTSANQATVRITVNQSLIANDDFYTIDFQTSLAVNSGNHIMLNDVGTGISSFVVTQPNDGILVNPSNSINSNGTFNYSPSVGFLGQDSFIYEIRDGISTAQATVFIDVRGIKIGSGEYTLDLADINGTFSTQIEVRLFTHQNPGTVIFDFEDPNHFSAVEDNGRVVITVNNNDNQLVAGPVSQNLNAQDNQDPNMTASNTVLFNINDSRVVANPCYDRNVTDCWLKDTGSTDDIQQLMEGMGLTYNPNDLAATSTELSDTLAAQNGLTSGQVALLSDSTITALLTCMNREVKDLTSRNLLILNLSAYQEENCGTSVENIGCYPVSAMECWAKEPAYQGDIEIVFAGGRGVPSQPGDIAAWANSLSESLKNKGFSMEEILSMKDPLATISGLLGCLGINVSEKATQDDVIALLSDYQLINCGEAITSGAVGCYPVSAMECWAGNPVYQGDIEIVFAGGRGVPSQPGDITAWATEISASLNSKGFDLNEILNMKDVLGTITGLLTCLGITVPRDATQDDVITLLSDYQAKNCGTPIEGVRVKTLSDTETLNVLSQDSLLKLAADRNLDVSSTNTNEEISTALATDIETTPLTSDELSKLTVSELDKLLVEMGESTTGLKGDKVTLLTTRQ